MRRFDGLDDLSPDLFHDPIVTIGVFDGVHRGHRLVLDATIDLAHRRHGEAVVLTFGTHPRAIIEGKRPLWLTSLEHRVLLFEKAGIDATIVLPFDDDLRNMTGDEFVELVLVERVGVKGVVLGFNSRFGKDRSGDRECLERNAARFGFEILFPPDVLYGAHHISSTAIRAAVAEGRIDDAAAMLGRPVSLLGEVVEGDRRGRTIGFPTANLDLLHEVRPPAGVYAGRVELDGRWHLAIANIGTRPTFEKDPGSNGPLVEVHVLDFEGELYGRLLELHFVARLRDERRFPSVDELRRQLERDRERCRELTENRADPTPPDSLDGGSGAK